MAGPVALGTTATTVYTCGAPTNAVIREVHVCNTTGAQLTFRMSIGADAAGTRLYSDFPVVANGTFDASRFTVLNPTETVQAYASGAGLTLEISGVEF
jgi:hypothetical protein